MKRLLALAGLIGALALAASAFAGSAGATTSGPVHLVNNAWPPAGAYHWHWD